MKILIIKPSSFGDIIQANPVIQAIKSEWPDCKTDWLVFEQFKAVVELFENISEIKTWNRNGGIKAFFDTLKNCNKEKYNLVIDLQGLLRTAVFAKLLKAETKIGVSGMKELSWLFLKEPYKKNSKQNAVVRNLKSLTYITGKEYNPEFKIKNELLSDELQKEFLHGQKVIGFMPFARGKTKNWNINKYCRLAQLIKNYDDSIQIIVLGSKNDYGKIKSEHITDLCGRTDIKQLNAVLRKCNCVIGADTGSMHLANAIGIKNIFIFGGSDIYETSPYGNNSVVISSGLKCSPCRGKCKYKTEKCLDMIIPEQVFESVKQWIK